MRRASFIEYEGQQWRIAHLADATGLKRATLYNRIERFGATATGIARSLATGLLDCRQAGIRGAAASPWQHPHLVTKKTA